MTNDKYTRLVELVNLKSIELNALNCNRNNDLIRSIEKQTHVSLKHDIKNVELGGSQFLVQVSFVLKAYIPPDQGQADSSENIEGNVLFVIDFQMDLTYMIGVDAKDNFIEDFDEELRLFVENNALINAWPYARETISSLTTRMGFPSLSIPSYKYMPKY